MQPIKKIADPTAKTSQRYKVKSPSRGGARAGAGRPKGSTNKITMDTLLTELETVLGHDYAHQIAINYIGAISREDWGGVRDYDRVLLGKVVADRTQVEVTDSAETVEARKLAFAEALRDLAGIRNDTTN